MKPTSIVSLIVAVAIIVAGIITCAVANNMAEKSGNLLFAESRGDDFIKTVALNDNEIIKISLNFTDADVNIYGSSTTSYIEFVNFSETLYSLTESSTSVSFNESPDFSSLLKFWESGFSFKGVRYLLNPRTYDESKMKSVNIYLSPACEIKQFDITAEKTSVTIENLHCAADYIFNAQEIDLFASSVVTNSTLRINSGNGASSARSAKVEFKSSSFANVLISADHLSLSGLTNDVVNTKISCKNGSIDWSLPHYALSAPITDASISFVTDGKIIVNGEECQSPFTHSNNADEARHTFDISAGEADINISSDFSLEFDKPEDSADDTTDTTEYGI